ncbi:MAG: zinc ABC transporter substrate-binding protein [Chloroflexi bacterium]|nr:zinc ABC transporter substrate-binding protein [Chloroflexota bacterium]
MRPKLAVAFLAVAIIAILIYGVGAFRDRLGTTAGGTSLQVTASFYPLAEFAKQVGKEKVQVRNLTPPGAEPHDFDPSPRDLVDLQRSQVFIYNGAGFEPWVDKVLTDLPRGGPVVVDSSEGMRLLESGEDEGDNKHGLAQAPIHSVPSDVSGQAGAAFDPHFWLDPVLAKQQVDNIKEGLIKADPTNDASYKANASAYKAKLDELDGQFRQGLSSCKRRDVIASHDAFQYLARRYSLNVVAISGLSPDDEPSPRRLAEIVEFARANSVKYIFFETLVSPRLADTIAREVGAKTLVFNSIEGLTSEEQAAGKDYLSVQRENLANLRIALECQ